MRSLENVLKIAAVLTVAAMFPIPQAYGAPDIYVSPGGGGSGTGWGDATSLANALATASPNDVIWMEQGSYTDASSFTITTEGLQIYGGFDGTETVLSQRDWTNHVVLLNGQGARRVLDIQADDTLLDGLVITNGLQKAADHIYGGGLLMSSGVQNLTMLNCKVVGNTLDTAGNYGKQCYGVGAYFNNAGTVLLSNCVIRANEGTYLPHGIGFWSGGSTVTLLDCEIRENYDSGGDHREGKGFYLASGTLTMVGTIVADNGTTRNDGNSGKGCGGHIAGGNAYFTNCVFMGNSSPNSTAGDGGVLYITTGNSVTIESCTFANNVVHTNSVGSLGGAIYQTKGTVTIKNSIFWGNEAGTDASAGDTIYQAGGILNISYSCLEGTNTPHLVALGAVNWGSGNITNDPLFAVEYTDVHLKSQGSHWNGSRWVKDAVTSPCIDAGDPASDYSREPNKNGKRINMGGYGNTAKASRNPVYGTVIVVR